MNKMLYFAVYEYTRPTVKIDSGTVTVRRNVFLSTLIDPASVALRLEKGVVVGSTEGVESGVAENGRGR